MAQMMSSEDAEAFRLALRTMGDSDAVESREVRASSPEAEADQNALLGGLL